MAPDSSFSATPARTLRDLLHEEGRLPFDRAARLLEQVGEGLRRVHAGGLAYGVLEPSRVLVDPGSGRAWLADASGGDGQAKPAYLSPEQIDGRGPDMRSDIHALGLIGWEMLTGREPWEGESLYGMVVKQREQDLPRLTTLRPGIPRPLLLAIEGALHKHPYDRWATVDEFLAQLRSSRPVLPRGVDQGAAVAPSAAPAAPSTTTPASAGSAVSRTISVAGPAASSTTSGRPSAPSAARSSPPGVPATPPPPVPVPSATAAAPAAPTARMAPPPSVVAPATVTRPRKRRGWIGRAVFLLALLAAGAAALVAYQGRSESTQTAAWLDSLTTGAAAGEIVIDSGPSADSLAIARRARAARLARERARRDSAAAAARRAAEDSAALRPAADSVPETTLPGARPAALARPRPDSAARRDSVRRDSVRRDSVRRDSVRRDSTPPDTTARPRPDSTVRPPR